MLVNILDGSNVATKEASEEGRTEGCCLGLHWTQRVAVPMVQIKQIMKVAKILADGSPGGIQGGSRVGELGGREESLDNGAAEGSFEGKLDVIEVGQIGITERQGIKLSCDEGICDGSKNAFDHGSDEGSDDGCEDGF